MSALIVESLPARRLPRIASGLIGGADLDRLPGMQVWTGLESIAIRGRSPGVGPGRRRDHGGLDDRSSISLRRDALHVLVPAPPG